jgi:heat shock protein HslJ
MFIQNQKIIYYLFSLLILISLVLGACTAPAPAPSPAPTQAEPPTPMPVEPVSTLGSITQEELVGANWQWVGGRDASTATYQVANPENYTLTFSDDGSVFIVADCNTSRGTYTLDGETLGITLGATTRVACEPGSMSDQFLSQLEQSSRAGSGLAILPSFWQTRLAKCTSLARLRQNWQPIWSRSLRKI